jgi:hypothetical protein
MNYLKTVRIFIILDSLATYESFEDMINNHIDTENSPICYLVFNFSFIFGEGKNIYELFLKNSSPSDALILLTNGIKVGNNGIRNFTFNIDSRLTKDHLETLLKTINPGKVYTYGNTYELNKEVTVSFDNISYESAYLVSGKDLKIDSDNKYLFDVVKENESLYLSITDNVGVDTRKTDQDRFEEDLDHMLAHNHMKINELYTKGSRVEIRINKNNTGEVSEVIIDNGEISITCDNSEDLGFLNNLFFILFK